MNRKDINKVSFIYSLDTGLRKLNKVNKIY